jgi:hypothetical protein
VLIGKGWLNQPVRAALYIDTARDMRPRQLIFRTRRLVPPVVLATGLKTADPAEARWVASGLGVDPAPQFGPAPLPHEDRAVSALGIRREVDRQDFWTDPGDGLLFLFHLHGFAELARYAAGLRTPAGDRFWAELIEDWLVRQRQPRAPAWHPYPTSERIIAWSAALSAIGSWPEALRLRVAAEVWRQSAYLARCVEHDIGGNHVLRNATALTFAGAAFPRTRLLDQALALLQRETARQFLADGAHEERSTSYHRRAQHDLDEVADLLARSKRSPPRWLADAGARGARWQARLAGPDRRLPLLNDAWEGPPLAGGAQSGAQANPNVVGPGEAGYLVLSSGADQVVFDLGPLCPAHLPAHAHADALSFVLWLDGRPLIVDPGSGLYEGPLRARLRATAAHNTVEVDGTDQCVLWGSFRASHLPRVRHTEPRQDREAIAVAGAHNGYRRLPDRVTHHRALVWAPSVGLVVVDRLGAERPHRVRSTLHLAPGVDVTERGATSGATIGALGEGASMRREAGIYSPYLGSTVSAPVLQDTRTVDPWQLFGWSILRPGWRTGALSAASVILERDDAVTITVALPWVSRRL